MNSGKYLLPWPATSLPAIDLSYFAPAYYKKIFAKVDTADANGWKTLTDTMYDVLAMSFVVERQRQQRMGAGFFGGWGHLSDERFVWWEIDFDVVIIKKGNSKQ